MTSKLAEKTAYARERSGRRALASSSGSLNVAKLNLIDNKLKRPEIRGTSPLYTSPGSKVISPTPPEFTGGGVGMKNVSLPAYET